MLLFPAPAPKHWKKLFITIIWLLFLLYFMIQTRKCNYIFHFLTLNHQASLDFKESRELGEGHPPCLGIRCDRFSQKVWIDPRNILPWNGPVSFVCTLSRQLKIVNCFRIWKAASPWKDQDSHKQIWTLMPCRFTWKIFKKFFVMFGKYYSLLQYLQAGRRHLCCK